MNTRSSILSAASELLASSPTGDISTRAVCDAAGVTQPVLYRLFGDKDGLLAAVVDTVWEEYLASKRSALVSDDPLADLRAGWDRHAAFARAHPHPYRLLFGSALTSRPAAAVEAMSLLRAVLERVAAHGRLRLDPVRAAEIVMAANSGVALGQIVHPELYPDPSVSVAVREATFRGILIDSGVDDAAADDPAARAATTLRAQLSGAAEFSAGEQALLTEWLGRLQDRQTPTA